MQPILFFADRRPPFIGGMEVHANYFIDHFENHPKFPLAGVITRECSWREVSVDPSIIFFNSGHWIEEMDEIKKAFPHALFFYRTGGNEILKADLSKDWVPSHQARQRYWVERLNRHLDILVTNSLYTENRLRSLGITSSFLRVVGGVNVDCLSHSYSICTNKPPILFSAARFVPYKNHGLLISTLHVLVLKGYSFNLRLAGDGPLQESIKKEVERLKMNTYIEFLGVLDNQQVCQEMKKADVYIQLSSDYHTEVPGGSYMHSEGMGRSILEAITAGVFVLAGKSGALSEVVHQEKGVLVDINSPDVLLNSLEKILTTIPSRRSFSDLYKWENVFGAYEAAFSHRKI